MMEIYSFGSESATSVSNNSTAATAMEAEGFNTCAESLLSSHTIESEDEELCSESRETSEGERRQRGNRLAEVELLEAYRESVQSGKGNLLEFCRENEIPESTMRHWLSRQEETEGFTGWVELVESPDGLRLLHNIVTAAMFVITQEVGGGYRAVSHFLELSGLSRVVAAGYGTQHEAVKTMEEVIVEYGKEEKKRLGAQMLPRSITVAQDETFHSSRPCLVAMEPVSNFILLEEYAQDRQTETWNEAMSRALEGLPVSVFQSTGDEAKALLKHAREALGAHHSPDLFHPQQDISRATSLQLKRQIKTAADGLAKAQQSHDDLVEEAAAYEARGENAGHPRDYASRVEQAEKAVEEAESVHTKAKARHLRVREAARTISDSYHPFDLETGKRRDGATVEADLEAQFVLIEEAAEEAKLSDKCRKLLKKARRIVAQMGATIALIHTFIQTKLEALELSEEMEAAVVDQLVPAFYLEEAAKKAPTSEKRSALRKRAAKLRASFDQTMGTIAGLEDGTYCVVEEVARECAQLFQRSSSCVEGRNGVLALRRHSLHRLTPRKLAALTVVHNYFITRPDGTTAASRFFGRAPRDLFEHLLNLLPPPSRPASKRYTLH